ncbi:hypothetical protein HRR83_006358 [Exophiala dermatitidis]|uniref:ATP synthase F0 n=2 Tax=Exophiala dermatitidis TaxID=5970 RepID=H6CA33_EXODN|nr:uncharacterized protein HMPREF1120_07972 [Exophiala dermatitidis NIH/UT8656]KAJ4507372.1 hypothetical protein HRR75_006721 [Exophiala dermatitidis]EHY59997.1 hypothetical protein HMPREF1120_07972 [Exophiala dermatitidis NIH/UT8656]KAJ4509362.1 hypothetical protein HRR73_007216 [Exophiala dermatitidis]KAJ4509549.1 hypothetical protein HRR74_007330 [Exophiala dermatitidis]KAJ4530550.1 hypothetical protein HRR76_008258 [Exophiala dermatitidis]
MAVSSYNPFAKREEFTRNNLIAYKVLTILTWLLLVVVGAIYTFNKPEDCKHKHRCHTIWGQNNHVVTPFTLNSVVTSIYWVVVLILQAHYIRYLWHAEKELVTSAANVGSHFIFHNLLTFGFIMLWVRGHFWQGELLLIINLFNLTLLYFGHPTTPLFIHIPIVSAPLAWNYVAILWDGAAMVHAHSLPARIVANVFIWGILVLGGFFILTFKDYTMGIELAILSLSLGLGQVTSHVIAVQWIFAFVIAASLLVLSLIIGAPRLFGQDNSIRQEGAIVSEDRERAPLLNDQ